MKQEFSSREIGKFKISQNVNRTKKSRLLKIFDL